MAKNFRTSGKRIDVVIAGSVVTSGKETRNAGIVGIPLNHGLVGETVSFAQEGVWGLTLLTAGVVNANGTHLFYDTTADALSIGAANDDTYFGQIVQWLGGSLYAVHMAPQPQEARAQNQPDAA